jgi:L-ornithine N5-oxygenase
MSHNGVGISNDDGADVIDVLAFGFGPSNLALAVAATETGCEHSLLFLEQKPAFSWHPGMMFASSKLQISFLKDLVTLRDPTSPYTFLQYLKAKGRLERFVNLREFFPSRLEFSDYFAWVAAQFGDLVRYGSQVRAVRVAATARKSPSLFEVDVGEIATGSVSTIRARNIVYACGGTRRLISTGIESSSRIIHSDDFLTSFPIQFPSRSSSYAFAVVGDGQSAGEIVAYLLDTYPASTVHLLIPGYAPRPSDNSPFVNEAFFSGEAEEMYATEDSKRVPILGALRNTNYGVMDRDLIDHIYRAVYLEELQGNKRLIIHPFVRVKSAHDTGRRLEVRTTILGDGGPALECDGVVMATGYRRTLDPEIFDHVLPFIRKDDSGRIALSRQYRAETVVPTECGLYLQGYSEATHGIGDTLLSMVAFRSKEIWDDICCRNRRAASRERRQIIGEYPPKRHLETDREILYEVINRYRFATVVSVGDDREALITHVPMTLDVNRGECGVLFGHMDRSNPHVNWLDGRPIRAIFHGPNSYISPNDLGTDQLPTWNSIAVHVRGKARVVEDATTVLRGIARICEDGDRTEGAYRLNFKDARIPKLIDYIVGFEIDITEIIGRFKLSQDRIPSDRALAAEVLMRRVPTRDQEFIMHVHKLSGSVAGIVPN